MGPMRKRCNEKEIWLTTSAESLLFSSSAGICGMIVKESKGRRRRRLLGAMGVIFFAKAKKMTPTKGLKRSVEDLRVLSHIPSVLYR